MVAARRSRLSHRADTRPRPWPNLRPWVTPMPTAKSRSSTILSEFELAQTELVGKAVILTDGKAGTVESVWLDEMHGLRISVRGHDGKWPISTIKLAQTGRNGSTAKMTEQKRRDAAAAAAAPP